MRYLSIFRGPESDQPPSEAEIAAMGELIERESKAGILKATEGCLPSKHGMRVRRAGDKVTVTDGPFSEAKEVIGGFAIVEVASKEEAVAMAQRFLAVVGDGECEIRQLYDEPAL
jgi:hypothetical protein